MYPKTMIFIAIFGVSLSLLLGFFSVITLEVVALSVMVFIGIPTLMTQVNIKPKEKERKQEPKQVIETEKEEVFKDETIRVTPDNAYIYEFELEGDDILKGEISSTSHIDVYFVNKTNFKKWDNDRDFNSECCNESVLKTKIDYEVPRSGKWYLLMENNGRKTAIVKIFLYYFDSN